MLVNLYSIVDEYINVQYDIDLNTECEHRFGVLRWKSFSVVTVWYHLSYFLNSCIVPVLTNNVYNHVNFVYPSNPIPPVRDIFIFSVGRNIHFYSSTGIIRHITLYRGDRIVRACESVILTRKYVAFMHTCVYVAKEYIQWTDEKDMYNQLEVLDKSHIIPIDDDKN
jgi:hypothetical protein